MFLESGNLNRLSFQHLGAGSHHLYRDIVSGCWQPRLTPSSSHGSRQLGHNHRHPGLGQSVTVLVGSLGVSRHQNQLSLADVTLVKIFSTPPPHVDQLYVTTRLDLWWDIVLEVAVGTTFFTGMIMRTLFWVTKEDVVVGTGVGRYNDCMHI